jgi:hypothetical protein
VDGTCSTLEKEEECIYEFSRESEGKGSLRRPKRRWEDNIDVDLKAIEAGNVEWTHVAQDIV